MFSPSKLLPFVMTLRILHRQQNAVKNNRHNAAIAPPLRRTPRRPTFAIS
jgi:hypothetical protein